MNKVTSRRRQSEYLFDFSGGILCLDFANTVSHREDPIQLAEHLKDFGDLVNFAEQAGIFSPSQAATQRNLAQRDTRQARRLFHKALDLREAIFRTFSAGVADKTAARQDLQLIDDFVREALIHRKLRPSNGGYRWQWLVTEDATLEGILWPIAQSAAELLTSGDLGSVRLCQAADCEWLFLDNSRNRSRRWCDMKSCGNREKARRHYLRAHE